MIKIKQATKRGYIELEDGGLFNASYPKSELRRGRVIDGGGISPTLQTGGEIMRFENYRIRRLTPFEYFRLMGVTTEDARKMLNVNSDTQCYKQAGNSIVVDVMVEMFRRLI